MSFRARLTSFFVVIVLLPMIAIGALVFRLISDSQNGKAGARADGAAAVATNLYASVSASARADAVTLAHDTALLRARGSSLAELVARAGVSRIMLASGGRVLADEGDRTAIAPSTATVSTRARSSRPLTLTVWPLSAAEYVHELAGQGVGVVVAAGGRTLAESLRAPHRAIRPGVSEVTIAGTRYRQVTETFASKPGAPIVVTVLSALPASAGTSNRLLAALFIAGALLLALAFALLSSRALQRQLTRFLKAARRLAAGDFSAPVHVEGSDDFAALAHEFNRMSEQLERRLHELSKERSRLRESVRRIGQTFASNLDRRALLDLALKTAIDATESDCGRVSARPRSDEALAEAVRDGELEGLERPFYEAEREALGSEDIGRAQAGELEVLSVALRPLRRGGRAHGLITIARRSRSFVDDEADLLRSLAGQAALALENIDLHLQVSRQAVTDELTGLANHGRFQELLAAEAEEVRRYHHQVGLIMVDLDNFKSINDTYGHQQGDIVLRQVGAVLRQNSRDVDTPARYGGEEMALILPHTDIDGAFVIAERVRQTIEELRIPRTDSDEPLRVTASLGVAASGVGDKDALIAEADSALYRAKREGKNRTIRGRAPTANPVGAE